MDNKITPKAKSTQSILPYKSILFLALGVALILLLPLAAMQVNHEVNWSPADFALAGTLLFGTGLAYVLLTRKAGNFAYRAAAALALGTALLLVWSNLAVGIIGSEDNPANLMYIGVLAVGLTGALIARLRPSGMARALFAMALAQALVTLIALFSVPDLAVPQLLALNGFFAALWLGSAWLFQRAK